MQLAGKYQQINRNTDAMNCKNSLKAQDDNMTAQAQENTTQHDRMCDGANAGDELGSNSEIGLKLRALYTGIQEEAIPERFLDLLEKLDQAEHKLSSVSGN